MQKILLMAIIALMPTPGSGGWGFYAHEKINRLAVFTLPPDMIGFYKSNIAYITSASVNPDKRRYAVEEEGARHFLDVDHYGDSAFFLLPQRWAKAHEVFNPDTLQAHGVLPWHIFTMYLRLRHAFLVRDPAQILKVSAELGHYIADAHVPLHTTRNYNGQLTGQDGIHGFWESRLPEVFFGEYNFFVGRAEYVSDPQATAWHVVRSSYELVDDVLAQEKRLASRFGEKKYSFETRGNATVKVYAIEYTRAYHKALGGMVERQMRASVKTIGDFWYTAWVEAGQPDLRKLVRSAPTEEEIGKNGEDAAECKARRGRPRPHE